MRFVIVILSVSAMGCATRPPGEQAPILFDGLGSYRVPVSTADSQVQRYFDQGLALCHGYNHDEAARAFAEAARIDPNCVMAYWGEAYALGPNYNLSDEGDEYAARAFAALQKARGLDTRATELESDLVAALSTRFAMPRPASRDTLNANYSAAMRVLWRKYPNHPDVGFLFADALLCQNPWDQWDADGRPKRDTLEIVSVLERVLELNVEHPGASHLYIHAMEGSHTPERAEAAADRLESLMPGVGHMVHMPSHIYMRVGTVRRFG